MIFLGRSECPICGKFLVEGDDIIGLPPLIDTTHLLFRYFDTGMHRACYDNWNKKDKIEEQSEPPNSSEVSYLYRIIKMNKPRAGPYWTPPEKDKTP